MPFKYQPGFFEALGKSPAVVAIVDETTNAFAQSLRSDAPRDSGEYAGRFETGRKYQQRVIGIVRNTDPKAWIVESKTGYVARKIREFARGRR